MGQELEYSIQAFKILARIFFLQLLCLLLFAYGLFFFHKQLSLVSKSDLQSFVKRDEWFELQQHETIGLFILEGKNSLKEIKLHPDIQNVTLNLKREPQCYEGQEIIALMTGSYSSLLEYVYSQDKLIEDSIFHQLNHTQKQVVYIGEQTFWQDLFPHMTHSDYNSEKDLKYILTSTETFKADFIIGLIEDNQEFYKQIEQSLSELKKKTLILILEQDECSIYGSRQSRLIALSNTKFQNIVQFPDLEREEIDMTSTLSAIMGLPIPFCNFGQVIPELYSKDMDLELDGEQYSVELRTWYTVFYHILLNSHQMEHYISSFQKYYPLFFNTEKVKSLKVEIENLQKSFSNILDDIQPGQQGSNEEQKIIQKIKNQISAFRQAMKQMELIIQQSNFGQIHLMAFGLIFFIIAFSYLLITEFKSQQNLQLFTKLIKSAFYFNHTSPVQYNFNMVLTIFLALTFIFIRNDYLILIADIILHGVLLLNLDQDKIKKYILLSSINIAINAKCLGLIKTNWALNLADSIGIHYIFDVMCFLVIVYFAFKVLSTIYFIEIEFLVETKKKRIFKALISISLINIILSGFQYFFNDIISHDKASFLILLFFTIVSTILVRPFVYKSEDFNKLNCEAKWILVSINVLPLVFLDTHNEHIFIILILYLYQLFNFFHLIKNAGYLNSSMQVCYLIFLTIIIFQKGLLGSIEMGSLKNAIHIDHHHEHEESNIVVHSEKHGNETSDGNALFSFITNCIQIGAAPIILGGIFPVFQKIANKAKTIPREKFMNQSILKLLFDQDLFLSIENNYFTSLQNLITYLLLLLIILSLRIIFVLSNIILNYTSNFNLFRFYKEIFIFEIINFIFIYITILGCIHLFVQLNQNDQNQYELKLQSDNQQNEKIKNNKQISFSQSEEQELFKVNNRMKREDSLNEQSATQDDEI
ncbi:hypothetical protein ABPG74_012460 [Tetrahymena malaccensis]